MKGEHQLIAGFFMFPANEASERTLYYKEMQSTRYVMTFCVVLELQRAVLQCVFLIG